GGCWAGDPAAAGAVGVCWVIVTGAAGEGTMTVGRLGVGSGVGRGSGGMGRPRNAATPRPPMSFPRHPAAIRITPRKPLTSIINAQALSNHVSSADKPFQRVLCCG